MPEGAGLYFSWGNLDGHPFGTSYNFTQGVYDTTPAAAITEDLSLAHDAARAMLGDPWRMPTSDDYQELYDNCTSEWTTLNGVNGRLFTSNVNGNKLFLPAAGGYYANSLSDRGTNGDYWSSTYDSVTNAHFLRFNSSTVNPQGSNQRRCGFNIRPVQDGTPNRSVIPTTREDEQKDEETPTTEEPKDNNER